MALDSENQLALHQARKVQLGRSRQYIDLFLAGLDPDTDYTREPCPTCNYQPDESLFTKSSGDYAYCPRCDHIFLVNPISQEKLIEFYANYPTSSLEWHQNESEFYKRIYQQGIELIEPHRNGDRLLDIGCSSGYFLSIAGLKGFDAFGIEPNAKEAGYALKNGIKLIGSTIDSLPANLDAFDVISLWDVLEHIRQPVSYLASMRSLLSKDGLVFVQIPTSDSLAARIMREKCNMFDGIEHQTLFSARSLDSAFKQAGFTCMAKNSVISEIHAITNYLSYQADPYLDSPAAPFKADFLFGNQLDSNGMGYKIQAVYRVNS